MPHHSSSFSRKHLPAILAAALSLTPAAYAQTNIASGSSRYDANTPGSYMLAEGVTRGVTSGGNEAIRIADSGTSGTYTVNINGTVSQTGSGRGIRTSTANVNFVINIGATGLVRASTDDAIQGRGGPINITNLGTLYSGTNINATPTTAIVTGRGINLRDVTGGGTIVNGSTTNSTALIRADGGDAVRVGSGFTFTNYGTILAAGVVNDASTNNVYNSAPNNSTATTYSAGAGFSFEDQDSPGPGATNSTLTNYGSISGSRHGVQAAERGTGLTVINQAGGSIIGRNGSGVGFDTTETDASKIVVNNYGLIRGDYAGVGKVIDRTGNASATHDGDGDGVDIDGAATIRNYSTGQIISTGAGGFDSNGRANASEAISIGGGIIENAGLIRGADYGIVVNNDSIASRSGVAATSITNQAGATIEGQNGFAIRLENKLGDARDNDTLINAGTIIGNGGIPDGSATVLRQNGAADVNSTGTLDGVTYTGTGSARFIRGDGSAIQMGEGDDVITNTGTIIGNSGRAINMEGGNDTLNFNAGSITGSINGGTGNNTLNLGNSVSHSDAVMNFQSINVASGSATLSGAVSGTTLTKGGAGTLVLSSANTYSGDTTVNAGTLRVNNISGSATGLGNVFIASGASLAGIGHIAGDVVLEGRLAPGNSIGTLTIDGDVTWNGTLANSWQFELGASNASDQLLVGGDFLKGTGLEFTFDFGNTGAAGTFILVDWDGSTNFVISDFNYTNLRNGFTGEFSFNGSSLQFTTTAAAIPEPSTYAALLGAGALGFILIRRRRAKTN